MRLLSVSDADIALAAEALASGFLVAFPTETVYGLGADAFNPRALARVFEVKNRPRFDPLIVHIACLDDLGLAADLALLPVEALRKTRALSGKLWPGPLTLILPKRPEIPSLATAGLPTVAVRLPDHPVARKLIALSSGAVAAPSANPFGRLSPTRAEHVRAGLGDKVDLILDGGRTRVGLESTVLDMTGPTPRILRPGGASRERIEALIGPVEAGESPAGAPGQPLLAPGTLKSHYAPRTPLSLHSPEEMAALAPLEGTGRLFFCGASREKWLGKFPPAGSSPEIRVLSEAGDTAEAAANLFETLHELDLRGLTRILAEEAPPRVLGPAINDRLRRAAAPGCGGETPS